MQFRSSEPHDYPKYLKIYSSGASPRLRTFFGAVTPSFVEGSPSTENGRRYLDPACAGLDMTGRSQAEVPFALTRRCATIPLNA